MKYLVLVVLATVLVCGGCSNDTQGGIDGGTTDTDTDTDTDVDTDVDTDTDSDTGTGIDYDGSCEEEELIINDDAEFYAFCVPRDDQECIDAVSAIIEQNDDFDTICHESGSSWIECDPETEYYCMTSSASGYTIDLLCALTVLECIEAIYSGVYV